MTETTEQPVSSTTAARARRGEGLSGMVLADLKAMAAQLGIKGTSGLRKGDLVSAIASHQNSAAPAANGTAPAAPAAGKVAGTGDGDATLRPTRRRAAARPEGAPRPAGDEHAASATSAPMTPAPAAAGPSADAPVTAAPVA